MTDDELAVWQLVDEDWAPNVVQPRIGGGQLEAHTLELNRVVFLDRTFVLNAEQQVEIHANERHERALCFLGFHRESSVEIGDIRIPKIRVCCLVAGDSVQSKLLGQPSLDG